MGRRGLTCLSYLHRHTQSSRLASRCFREVTTPSDTLLPGCFMQQVITEKLLKKSECKPGFPQENNRAEREKETETSYSLSWLQSTDIIKKEQLETLGYMVLRVVFMLIFCIPSFEKSHWKILYYVINGLFIHFLASC